MDSNILTILIWPVQAIVVIAIASASDASGIAKVEVYIDSQLICTDSTSPYNCNWKVPAKPKVTYIIQAKAYDKVNNIALTSIKVTSK